MATIKSALELALERTKDIVGDKTALKARSLKEEGMRLLNSLIEDADFDPAKKLASYAAEEGQAVKDGLFQVIMARLNLPSNDLAIQDLTAIEKGLAALFDGKNPFNGFATELGGLFKQYLEDRSRLYEAVVQQYEPVLRQKEQQLAQQTGQRVRLSPEQDPEFQRFYKKNMDHLDEQYSQQLSQIKEQLEGLYAGGKSHK